VSWNASNASLIGFIYTFQRKKDSPLSTKTPSDPADATTVASYLQIAQPGRTGTGAAIIYLLWLARCLFHEFGGFQPHVLS
jgi:hypothetical protein